MIGYSPKLPLSYSFKDGLYNLNKTINSTVQQNLKNLMLTNPGEKIMDLSFGVGIRSYLHEQLTPLTKDRLRIRILDQIRKYMPFITVEKLDILSREDIVGYTETYLTDESITVKLEYSFPGQSKSQILNIPIK